MASYDPVNIDPTDPTNQFQGYLQQAQQMDPYHPKGWMSTLGDALAAFGVRYTQGTPKATKWWQELAPAVAAGAVGAGNSVDQERQRRQEAAKRQITEALGLQKQASTDRHTQAVENLAEARAKVSEELGQENVALRKLGLQQSADAEVRRASDADADRAIRLEEATQKTGDRELAKLTAKNSMLDRKWNTLGLNRNDIYDEADYNRRLAAYNKFADDLEKDPLFQPAQTAQPGQGPTQTPANTAPTMKKGLQQATHEQHMRVGARAMNPQTGQFVYWSPKNWNWVESPPSE